MVPFCLHLATCCLFPQFIVLFWNLLWTFQDTCLSGMDGFIWSPGSPRWKLPLILTKILCSMLRFKTQHEIHQIRGCVSKNISSFEFGQVWRNWMLVGNGCKKGSKRLCGFGRCSIRIQYGWKWSPTLLLPNHWDLFWILNWNWSFFTCNFVDFLFFWNHWITRIGFVVFVVLSAFKTQRSFS